MQLSRSPAGGDGNLDADTAIAGLYAAHWRPLVRLAWLFVHDQGRAEDVVQDAFVATHRNWDKVREQAAATAYLRRAVVNGCRSWGRHEQVVRRELVAEAGRADAFGRDAAPSAEREALADLGNAGMLAALRALPDRQREVLVLRYWSELSESQIAATLSISPGTVKSTASRALDQLEQLLEVSR